MLNNIFNNSNCCCRQKKISCPCCNQNNCCLEKFFCPRLRNYVLRGPRGFIGPRGPQGLPGVNSISSFASFSSPTNQIVETNATILLNNVVAKNGNITLVGGEIVLPVGTYLIDYDLDVTQELDGVAIIALVVNNVVDSNSQASTQVLNGNVVSLGSNTIISVSDGATLSIRNLSSQSVSTQNVSLSILKIV